MLPTFTAAMLLFHALLGCCWLHAEGCTAGALKQGAACQAADCCRAHGHASAGNKNSGYPCRCELNCHRLCVYLPPDKAPIESDHMVVAVAVVAEPTMLFADHLACTAARLCPLRAGAMPPLRLHLMHQLLLV